ncbi:hypothetical protein Moror_15081 [Moniliophthora roreri MCA 2997]|uniref:Integral membrane protein n=2 Tax=Moniliophthora roreri TaxID=221103 RepID=V2WNW1_MONRO|nr:hypothetical protein Moror_15081 [Moniliophthora roreri MCA 2997]KAI3616851.1 hypothetical protein WG66_004300 [Moniliophthora roreri]
MARQKSSSTNTTWDPILLIFQIISLQSLHYLVLCILTPPLLSLFADQPSLVYEGGAASVGMIMDWREMVGRATVRGIYNAEKFGSYAYTWAWSGGKIVGFTWREAELKGGDPIRGWIIAGCWVIACAVDILPIYYLIRRPRLILDFALTLVFNHLVLTTYYSTSLPTSIFFYVTVLVGAGITVIGAEQLCVRREMREGLKIDSGLSGGGRNGGLGEEEIELLESGERRD